MGNRVTGGNLDICWCGDGDDDDDDGDDDDNGGGGDDDDDKKLRWATEWQEAI